MEGRYKNFKHWLEAVWAVIINGYPARKLKVIGVTGTDGKTTTCHLIYEMLKAAGKKVALVSTVAAYIGDEQIDTGFHVTTPDAKFLQLLIKRIVETGMEYLVLEVTSHGLDQHRVLGCNFMVGVVTNITHEHLDYHKTQKRYLGTKAKLFRRVDYSVLNFDDKSFEFLKSRAEGKKISYSLKSPADFNLKKFLLKLKIPGDYNLQNALAAAAAASALGIEKNKILKSLNNFLGVLGRMDDVDLGQNFRVFIDFAHTPNALKEAFKTLKSQIPNSESKLIVVFGAAGERDKDKRSMMGKVAADLADVSILTAEDPRREKVEDICKSIAEGFPEGRQQGKNYHIIRDRANAIKFAVNLAADGDVVGFFGKAHEKSMCFGKKEYPWDEFVVVEKAINERLKHGK